MTEYMSAGLLNCGPVAAGMAVGVDPETVRRSWPTKWANPSGMFRLFVLQIDTPWHHKKWFIDHPEYNAKFFDNFGALMAGIVVGKTVILIHNTRKFWTPYTEQHWCRIVAVAPDSVTVDMDGSGEKFRTFCISDLRDWMERGWPFPLIP